MVFTEITSTSEHLANFANYIKIDYKKSPLVMLNPADKKKYVFKG